MPPDQTPGMGIFQESWLNWMSSNPKRKGISFFYNTLHDKLIFKTSNPLFKWTNELNTTITEHQWKKEIVNNVSTSKCTTYWEMAQKIHLRWYYTPYMLAKFKSAQSNQCWRGCGLVGTLSHMLWSCPNLRSYWNSIFRLILKLTGFIIRSNIRKAILSIDLEKFPHNLKHVVMHILHAARLILMRKWKTNLTPNIGEVVNLVSETYALEQIMAYKQGYLSKFFADWRIWRELHKGAN